MQHNNDFELRCWVDAPRACEDAVFGGIATPSALLLGFKESS